MRRQILSSLFSGLSVTAVMTCITACSSTDETPVSNSVPACSDVWVEGKTLPADYEGCMDSDSLVISISDNTGAVVYDDRFSAQPGQTIRKVGA